MRGMLVSHSEGPKAAATTSQRHPARLQCSPGLPTRPRQHVRPPTVAAPNMPFPNSSKIGQIWSGLKVLDAAMMMAGNVSVESSPRKAYES